MDATLHRTILLSVLLTSSLMVAGCRSAPPRPDDTALNTSVQQKLAGDAAIGTEPIQASVQSGVAILQGNVSSEAARALAASDAAQVEGIRSVVNQLTIQTATTRHQSVQVALPPPRQPAPHLEKPSPVIKQRANQSAATEVERYDPAPIERRSPPPDQSAQTSLPLDQPTLPRTPQPPTPSFRNITIPSGTTLSVRINQTLDSATAQQGDTFSGSLASDVVIDDVTALAAGTSVSGRLDQVHDAGHFKGSALLTLSLVSLNHRGEHTGISTDPYTQEGNGRGRNTAEKVGGGAAVGAILGGIFGGGKGAAIGAAAGGGLGAGANGITRGQQVQIPSETLIRFRLATPVEVRASVISAPEGDANLQRHPDN